MPRYTKAEIEALREAGRKGGTTTAARLSPEERRERASAAAKVRWKNHKAQEPTDAD